MKQHNRRAYLSGILKSTVFVMFIFSLASCAPMGAIKGPATDLEGRMRADIGTAATGPVSVVEISAGDFAVMEPPAGLKKYKDIEVSLNIKDLSIVQTMSMLFNEYGIDHFIADKEARGGKISMIYNGPLQRLLDALSLQYGYYFSEENGVVRISDERTYMFSIPPMVSETLLQGLTSASAGGVVQPSNASTASASSKDAGTTSGQTEDFMASLKNMGAKDIVIDRMNSLVSFKCSSSSLTGIQSYLNKVRDNIAIVSLDILVAEVELSSEYSRGIDWTVFYNKNGDKSAGFELPQGLADELNPLKLSFGLIDGRWDISAVLSFLETQGRTEILQKPTLTVLNGNKAFLRAGKEIPYVDEIKITPTQVGATLTFLQEVTFKTILEGIEIEMLPRLRDDLLTLSLRGVITGLIEFVERETGGGKIAKPISTTREVQSVTALKSGEILKIGGIITSRDRGSSKGVPGAGVSGLTDFLFSSKKDANSRSEIVILVKPQVIRFKEKTS